MERTVQLGGRYYRMFPREKFLGYAERNFVLSPSNTAFVVVDVYNPGFDEGAQGSAYSGMISEQSSSREKDIIIHHIRPALDKARAVGFPIVYCANSSPNIALERSAYADLKRDTQDVDQNEIYAEQNIDPLEYHFGPSNVLHYAKVIAPQPGDYFVRKHVHSGFFDTRLDTLLRNLGVRNLIFVGFALDVCLASTMMDALWRNYYPILLRDCSYAIELEDFDSPGAYTARWITYIETNVGWTSTSQAFVEACNAALGQQAPVDLKART